MRVLALKIFALGLAIMTGFQIYYYGLALGILFAFGWSLLIVGVVIYVYLLGDVVVRIYNSAKEADAKNKRKDCDKCC